MPEITDEQLRQWQEDNQVAKAARKLWDDPRTSERSKALFKEVFPESVIPEHDIRTEMRDEFAKRDQKHEEEREAERVAREDAHWKAERKKTQDAYGITEDAMKDMEKWMYENNVGSYEVAATYHAAKAPKPSEPSSGPGFKDPYWNHGKSDLFKKIAEDPEEWGRGEILNALRADQNRNKQF
jgi:hypothetical protein